ncbi:MAG: ErfK/YbiS/YcfS/YnhG family protein [Ignavibacteria bacterium]|nr:MAG: ErfK/YbiS/YcfS/YnhG family protein [Ignavibacteria bacterium]KAF0160987.1 MAG: ErfK/YbiS/YcfS/YnhG family protein [Ignavibacteria bacterium]
MVLYGVILNLKEVTLEEAMAEKGISTIDNPKLKVDRKYFRIELYSGDILVKTYKAVFGKNNSLVKTSSNDKVTPIGEYKICGKDSSIKYHKFLRLNYPNMHDAAEGLKRHYLTQDEFDAIVLTHRINECTPEETRLGAEIGIHGIGTYDVIFCNLPFSFNWTNGSIAVSNENVDELYKVLKIGTPVSITY